MQSLTQEMYELGKKSKEKCIVLDDNYVLLNKFMSVSDQNLDKYINTIRKIKEDGLNTCPIIDYRLIHEYKYNYINGDIKYTRGIFLEERAKGYSFDSYQYFDVSDDCLVSITVSNYLYELENYIKQLEIRAQAEQFVYDKLVDDIMKMNTTGLTIDPKPSNYFFDEQNGYTIIDLIPLKLELSKKELENYPRYLFFIIFGYGRPKLYQSGKILNCMSREYHDRLFKATNKIIRKFKSTLFKYGYSNSAIKKTLYTINDNLYMDNITIIENSEMVNYIEMGNKVLRKKH